MINLPIDGGTGKNVYTSLHGFKNPAALSEHLKNASRNHYGKPLRAFLKALCCLLYTSMGHANHTEISRAIRSLREKIDKLDTPRCFRGDDKNAKIFVGIANALYAYLHHLDKEDFLGEFGNPERKIGWSEQDRFTGDDVVGFAMRQLNRDRLQSARIVGERLGIKPENCFDAFPPTEIGNQNNSIESWNIPEFIPDKIQVANYRCV